MARLPLDVNPLHRPRPFSLGATAAASEFLHDGRAPEMGRFFAALPDRKFMESYFLKRRQDPLSETG